MFVGERDAEFDAESGAEFGAESGAERACRWPRSAPGSPTQLRLQPSSNGREQRTLASDDYPLHPQGVPPLAKGELVRSARTIVPITDSRRDAARIIQEMVASGTPVYVTQNGRAAAVLLARVEYEGLSHRVAIHASAASGTVDPSTPEKSGNHRPAAATGADWRGLAGSAASGSRVPPRGSSGIGWQLVESRYGLVYPDTADFLEAEGFGLEPAAADEIGRRR